MVRERNARKLLNGLIGQTRGRITRAEIIRELRARPSNPNQLAKQLGLDYKTVQHHIRILEENQLLTASDTSSYRRTYFLTPLMEEAPPIFEEIWNTITNSKFRPNEKPGTTRSRGAPRNIAAKSR